MTISPVSGKRTLLSRTPLMKGRSRGSGWLGVVAIVRNVEEEGPPNGRVTACGSLEKRFDARFKNRKIHVSLRVISHGFSQ